MTGKLCPICECDHEKTGPCPWSQEPEYVEPEEDDGEGPFTRSNPFGEKD